MIEDVGVAGWSDQVAGLARREGDHRAKHQAPGFHVDLTDEGTLVVTTPSGITATTDAAPF